MMYLPHILLFLMVLSPLFIPVAVTIVHAIRNWRPRPSLPLAAIRARRRELAVEFD